MNNPFLSKVTTAIVTLVNVTQNPRSELFFKLLRTACFQLAIIVEFAALPQHGLRHLLHGRLLVFGNRIKPNLSSSSIIPDSGMTTNHAHAVKFPCD